ncbi:hypothetical protein T4E_5852 [Trichinella pseudospiralis]|uniref:Uncharacterized protein n=1 Tax=Trichinella pseudospiralis TaxID=6337 RepID=A0A0V0Y9S8_TRIPS|nr:hypothetical protein T4E_5852 [Trichinella pseudospiralis]
MYEMVFNKGRVSNRFLCCAAGRWLGNVQTMTSIHLRMWTMVSRGRGLANPLPTIDHFLRTVGDGRR